MARVLVVDDAAFMRKIVGDALAQGGHQVVGEAGDGVEAIASFQALRPEVITLDITMPEKDGLAALKEIIELDPTARVIMCSALGQESKVLESIKLGAKDFVVKPFQADRVLEAIERLQQELPGIGVVAYTATAGEFVRHEMDRLGVTLLLKSGDVSQLVAALRSSLPRPVE